MQAVFLRTELLILSLSQPYYFILVPSLGGGNKKICHEMWRIVKKWLGWYYKAARGICEFLVDSQLRNKGRSFLVPPLRSCKTVKLVARGFEIWMWVRIGILEKNKKIWDDMANWYENVGNESQNRMFLIIWGGVGWKVAKYKLKCEEMFMFDNKTVWFWCFYLIGSLVELRYVIREK